MLGPQGTSELPALMTTLVNLNSFPVQSGDVTFHWALVEQFGGRWR
jgi:hypothetical protein